MKVNKFVIPSLFFYLHTIAQNREIWWYFKNNCRNLATRKPEKIRILSHFEPKNKSQNSLNVARNKKGCLRGRETKIAVGWNFGGNADDVAVPMSENLQPLYGPRSQRGWAVFIQNFKICLIPVVDDCLPTFINFFF